MKSTRRQNQYPHKQFYQMGIPVYNLGKINKRQKKRFNNSTTRNGAIYIETDTTSFTLKEELSIGEAKIALGYLLIRIGCSQGEGIYVQKSEFAMDRILRILKATTIIRLMEVIITSPMHVLMS